MFPPTCARQADFGNFPSPGSDAYVSHDNHKHDKELIFFYFYDDMQCEWGQLHSGFCTSKSVLLCTVAGLGELFPRQCYTTSTLSTFLTIWVVWSLEWERENIMSKGRIIMLKCDFTSMFPGNHSDHRRRSRSGWSGFGRTTFSAI